MSNHQDKRVMWSWELLQTEFSDDENLYLLTEKHVESLLTAIAVMAWGTRWMDDENALEGDIGTFRAILGERLMTPIDICQLMVDCINNNDGVRDALGAFVGDRGLADNNSGNPVGSGDNSNVVEGVSCDLDSLYGAAVALEDFIYEIARDAVDIVINAATDRISWARLIDYFPVLGDLPVVDDINDLLDQFKLFGTQAFDVGYDVTIRQDNICDIWEKMCQDCELEAWSELAQVYRVRAGVTIDPEDAFEVLYRLLLGSFTDTAFVAAMQLFVVGAMSAGGSVAGMVGVPTLNQIAKSGEPDGDWAIFCDPCAPTCTEYNFRVSTNDFSGYQNLGGTWVDTEGWQFNQTGGNYATAWQVKTYAENQEMQSWQIEMTFSQVRSTNARNVQFVLNGTVVYDYILPSGTGDINVTQENIQQVVFDEIRLLMGQVGQDAANAYIRSFKFCPTPTVS